MAIQGTGFADAITCPAPTTYRQMLIMTTSVKPSKIFILAGFCLVAAVSSKAFISSLSDRVLREATEARKEVKQIKKEVDPIIAKETEKDPQETTALSASVSGNMFLEGNEREVLQALANRKYTLRTRSGLSKDTGIEKDVVNKILENLVARGLVGTVHHRERSRASRRSRRRDLVTRKSAGTIVKEATCSGKYPASFLALALPHPL
jgi:hypothetical protein